MARLLATFKVIVTRIMFSTHGFIGIWQVTVNTREPYYWYLCSAIVILFFEGIFVLVLKKNQRWRWFCPSVFLYLSSIVPAIWVLELDRMNKRIQRQDLVLKNVTTSLNLSGDLKVSLELKLSDSDLYTDMWVTLIEQFLMLILIIGRWMLPKGDLTRDELSQLLLVYIGIAADIIEFFDLFKDVRIGNNPNLVLAILCIWTWSLVQFTIVLSATKPRRSSRENTSSQSDDDDVEPNCGSGTCCNINVWNILLSIILQDAPFFTFRFLIIFHCKIITYMNIFFTCKNTLVIMLQLYRLHVLHTKNHKTESSLKRKALEQKEINGNNGYNDICMISNGNFKQIRVAKRYNKIFLLFFVVFFKSTQLK